MEGEILEKVLSGLQKGQPYCLICFKTSNETRLVVPKYLQQFAKNFNINIFSIQPTLIEKTMLACYMCEARAGAAVKFYAAVQTAVSARLMLNRHASHNMTLAKPKDVVISMCNKKLHEYQTKSTLRQTEVLIVDSNAGQWTSKRSILPSASEVAKEGSLIVPQNKDVETVVLDDDEDEPESPKLEAEQPLAEIVLLKRFVRNSTSATPRKILPKIVSLDELLANKSSKYAAIVPNHDQIICRNPENQDAYILHPLSIDDEGNTSVSTLSALLVNGQLVHDTRPKYTTESCVMLENKTVLSEKRLNTAKDTVNSVENDKIQNGVKEAPLRVNRLLQDLLASKSSGDTEDFDNVIDRLLQEKLESFTSKNNSNKRSKEIVMETMKRQKTSTNKSILNEEYYQLPKLAAKAVVFDMNAEIRPPPLARLTKVYDPQLPVGPLITSVRSEVAAPPQKTGKVDWEDKIPMDLISYAGPKKVFIGPTNKDIGIQTQHMAGQVEQTTSSHQADPNIIDLC
ncbi:uncharacterized protein LOC126379472 [Pectinophora gossypiella]|uniref:uncharacterized protein LOC126379472 n=1 Tax=Pectinophora gossypiella TaxID=13191 RepID=UPI00214E60B0|nr:uncharacterized protein LOC126379472 [Pectinophora gossypiella]